MSPYSIVVVLVVAMVLLAIGLNASDSLAGQLNATFTGRLTKAATWYAVGGIAAGPRVTHGRVWWASAKIGQVTVDTPLIDCRHGGGF